MTETEINIEWKKLTIKLQESFQKEPDLKTVLFLIGVQELGKGAQHFSKEEKQDLMHIAICKILSYSGYYELEGVDKEGWPIWKSTKKLPFLNILNQESLLKMHVLEYFEKEVFGTEQ
ncbi:hypothetical protein V6R21_28830 [Limibacter armeniacum]|uniref:hypothetical protein n=1 Tax=Limibacter armeniacum TaxID=466084 RepID=UPI002FE6BEBE